MEDVNLLTARLEAYLARLTAVNRRWSEWLGGNELAAIHNDHRPLLALQPEAESLFQELKQVISDRQQLLDDAQRSGLPHHDLTSLAQRLPAWSQPRMRHGLMAARQQLASLRRLHVATWVMLNQAMQYYQGSLQLLMVGNLPHVYHSHRHEETGGGRLLDQSL